MNKVILFFILASFGACHSKLDDNYVRVDFDYQTKYFKDSITHLCYCGIITSDGIDIVDRNINNDKYIPLTNVPCDSLRNVKITLINRK